MHIMSRENSSPPKSYKIKLYEKEIEVKVSYQSPPKYNKQNTNINGSRCIESPKQKKISNMSSPKKMDRKGSKKKDNIMSKRQKEFYEYQIQQSKNILEKYQQFQNHMVEGKIKGRIKVYSTSKPQTPLEDSSNRKYVPIRTVNIASNKREASPKTMVKIKLYSNSKSKSKLESSFQMKPISRLEQKKQKHDQSKKQEQKSILTPRRTRKYKIEVTTSKSKGKNDSMISNRQQNSREARRIHLKSYMEHPKSDAQGNSLNSVYID